MIFTTDSPVTEILKALVAYDTTNPPGEEQALAEAIASALGKTGFAVETPSCGQGRASVIASLKRGYGKKLVFNGHLDVVPAGSGWKSDPFSAMEREGRIYGRGTADMKGGVAAMIAAALRLAGQPGSFSGELVLNFVADEEITNLGTLSCKKWWKDADYVVIGEPTALDIEIAHRGTARFAITIEGRPCHSSMPWNGRNAIEKAADVILAIQKYNAVLAERKHPLLPSPTAAVTMIGGGEKDNIIPGFCTLCVDRRMIPGDTGDSVEQEIHEILQAAMGTGSDAYTYALKRYICLDAGSVDAASEIVSHAEAAFSKCFGHAAAVKDFPATCEQAIFTQNGVPAIIFGPGSIDQAHIADEYVDAGELEAAVSFYEAFAKQVLCQAQSPK